MSKKKNSKKPAVHKKNVDARLEDYSLDQLVTMPIIKVLELMMKDPKYKDFAYPYHVVMEVHSFIDEYKDHQAKCLSNLMADLKSSGILNGNTFTMDKRATTVIKATAKTASFKQLDTYKTQAKGMLEKLDGAAKLMEEAFESHPDMDTYNKTVLRDVVLEARFRLTQTFDFLTRKGADVND